MRPDWARPLVDARAFAEEQDRLRFVWTFLGFAGDASDDGTWFRASLGGRSVFVQRCGDALKGFENRCAHRFHPIRTGDRGRGPIVCPLHHWRYDETGAVVGVPMAKVLFGVGPQELGARLPPIEVETCGELVFGRFSSSGPRPGLAAFLGEGFPVLAAMSRANGPAQRLEATVAANWRLCVHLGLEDYHIVAVHPSTVGRDGPLKREAIGYHRFGLHSAMFTTPEADALDAMAEACRYGTWRSKNYRVFQLFPNLTVAHLRGDADNWSVLVLQYVPMAHDRSTMRAWIHPAPFAHHRPWLERWLLPLAPQVRAALVLRAVRKVLAEDNQASERLQSVAGQADAAPILGTLEQRLGWFEDSYGAVMAAGPDG